MEYLESIISELNGIALKIRNDEAQNLVNNILSANHIFVSGAGRSGLMIRAFANRLLHLGLHISVVGDITSPHTKKGDLLIIASASGETASLIAQAQEARKEKIKLSVITSNKNSSIGTLADDSLIVSAQNKKTKVETSIQPMGSLFEQSVLLICDSIVLMLMKQLGETNSSMYCRHANIE